MVLVVDDDPDVLLSAKLALRPEFSRVDTESDPFSLDVRLQSQAYDLLLLDMNFTRGMTQGKEGLRWLRKIRQLAPRTRVVLMTAYGDVPLAVAAMKEGAADFVLKPWDNEHLVETLRKAAAPRSLAQPAPAPAQAGLIGESEAMQQLTGLIRRVAPTDANVLILGENGTGKELIARTLHAWSLRSSQPFVQVDLGALSGTLFESELFGHVRGAFTDAHEDRAGRFEAASGGVLFLDEIGNLPPALQAKLLTVLQSRTVTRVGANRSVPVDIRLICATNQPLHELVAQRQFRQDLLYRINTVELHAPPLRSRQGDIPLLARHFLRQYARQYQCEAPVPDAAALHRLEQYAWPGNVRELQHWAERAVILGDLNPPAGGPAADAGEEAPLHLDEVEKTAIRQAIRKHGGNLSQAARELGLGRTTLYRKMQKYGL